MSTPVFWETSDGRKILLAEMSDSHVVHAVRFFRAAAAAQAMKSPIPHSNDPMWALARRARARRVGDITRRLDVIEDEAIRRKLVVDE